MKKLLTPAFLMTLLLLTVGSIVAGYFIKKLIARDVAAPVVKRVDVPMAIADLEPGTLITAAHLGKGPVEQGTLDRDVARTERVLVGRVVKNAIRRAEPVKVSDLYAPGQFPDTKVAPGMQAVSVSMKDGNSALRGVVRPGSRVNVHFTPSRSPDLARTGGLILTLFKGVKILRIDADSAYSTRPGSRGNDNNVTLELTPAQANVVLLAKDKGALSLTSTDEMDNNGGITVSDADRVTLDQILGGTKEPEPAKEKPSTVTEVYSGSGRRIQVFKEGKRLDRYGIENFDYNRRNGYGGLGGWGGLSGYGAGSAGYGNTSDRNTWDQGTQRMGGYYSVPASAGPNGGNGANGAGAPGNGGGSESGGGQLIDFGNQPGA